MEKALVAYMTWDRVVPWKVLSLPQRIGGDFGPGGYGSSSTQFCGYARKARTLWVVSKPKTRRSAPPTLVARFGIEGVYTDGDCPAHLRSRCVHALFTNKKKRFKWVAVANLERSEFFDLNDSARALKELNISLAKRTDRIWLGTEGEVGKAFSESVRQARKQTVFLSYTHLESRTYALDLAEELVRVGFSPWLDALAIPEYDVSREFAPSEERLAKLIRLGIRRSSLAIVIATEKYGRTPWTRREREWIVRQRHSSPDLPCVQVLRGPKRMRSYDECLEGGSPIDVAASIKKWWRDRS